jgi:predicted nucleotidyltransferase
VSLLSDVVGVLEGQRVRYALIGAAALAIHGVSRATADVDLLTLDTRVLDESLWATFTDRGVGIRLLKGELDDPLAGTVRVSAAADIVDIVVGRFDWQREIVESARRLSVGELSLPVAAPTGLILLKLHAGGPKDAWDVRGLLDAVEDAAEVASEVERALARLPQDARRLWSRLRSEG